jgi:cell division protein FtsB
MARVEELKLQVEREEQRLNRANREAELLKRDPEYISLIARDRLDLMKEGEHVFRLDPAKPDPSRMRLVH